jgi:hypothetical protein
MEKYVVIYLDKSNDAEYSPDLLKFENNKSFIKDTFEECENEIKSDIEFWKSNRPIPSEVSVNNNGNIFIVSDSYGSCSYYIRKIFI